MGYHDEFVGDDLHEPSRFRGVNNTGSTITSLKVVKTNNYNAPFIQILPITATSDRPAGVVKSDILDTEDGLVINVGILDEVDTLSFGSGSDVFADANGDLTSIDSGLFIGTVLISDSVNGVIFVNIAAQGSQGVAGAAATTGVVLATPTSATAQASIGAALAAAVSGDAVVVGPGNYAESVTVPASVTLVAPYGPEATAITGALATGTRVTLSNSSILSGFSVLLPTDATPAILYAGALTSNIVSTRLLGAGGSGIGVQNNSVGTLIINTLRYTGNCDAVFECLNGGETLIANTGLRAGTVNDVLRISGGSTLTVNDSGVFSTLTGTDGIEIGEGNLRLNSTNIEGVDNALHITSDLADVRLQSSILNGTSLDFLADPGLTTTVLSANASRFSSTKFSAPIELLQNGDIGLLFFDTESTADNTVRIINELSVGTSLLPSKINAGGGDSYIRGYVALKNTNLDVGTWTDITSDLVDPGFTPVELFPATSSNNTFFAGGDLEFFGLKMVTTVAIVLGAGSIIWEFWNGSIWTELTVMTSEIASPLDQFGNTTFQRVQAEHISFAQPTGWQKLTLNGSNKFWVRSRIVSTITTVPQADESKLLPNRLKIGLSGEQSLFGGARVERVLPWTLESLVDIVGASPANSNVDVSASINLALTDNQLTNGVTDSRGGIIQIPFGLDTSVPLSLSFEWFPSVNTGGNVELEVDFANIKIGDVLDGTLPETRISQIVAAPGNTGESTRTTFEIRVDELIPGDFIAIRVFRDASGGNADDTLVGNVILFGSFLFGNFWK